MIRRLVESCLLLLIVANVAAAQQPPPAQTPAPDTGTRPWIVVGGGFTSVLGDCTGCDPEAGSYRKTGSFLINAGVSLNARTDLGAEILWVPATTVAGETIRTTFVLGGAQFRFWRNRGFFVKGSAGMAFVRNWIVDLSGAGNPSPPFTSKALGVAIGAGWEWRLAHRFGVEVFGMQHVAALGDLTTGQATFENVIGNFWTIGGGVVIR